MISRAKSSKTAQMAAKYLARVLSRTNTTTTLLRTTPPSFLRRIAALPNGRLSQTAMGVRTPLSSSRELLEGFDLGADGKHWIIWVKEPEGNPTRDEIINDYVNILASVLGRCLSFFFFF